MCMHGLHRSACKRAGVIPNEHQRHPRAKHPPFGKARSFLSAVRDKHAWLAPLSSRPCRDDPPDPKSTNIILKPGIAFGTGEHATTHMCLQWLQDADLKGKVVVDYGCGSGILAVAACLFGCKQLTGVDVDPVAVQAAKDNAGLNGCAERCRIVQAGASNSDANPLADGQPADVVLANILKPALIDLQERLTGALKPKGYMVLSGLLVDQVCSADHCCS